MAHVLAVVPLYPPHSLVGAWITTHEHLRHLAARGHHVTVVAYLWNKDPFVHEGVRVLPRHEQPEADVVVAHLGDTGNGAEHAARLGVPLVYMVHGEVEDSSKLGTADLVVFNSEHVRGDHPGVVAAPPVDADRYRTTPGDRVTLVNLSIEKGGIVMWEVAKAMPDVSFLGVRGGYGRQIIRDSPNVAVLPVTDDMRDVYSATRVLLMPSVKESWGRVALEAACSGIPTIANPTAGLVESLGDAGIFVDRDDFPGWQREIRRLMDPDEWAEASSKALLRAAQLDPDASIETVANAVEALMQVPA